MSNSRYACRSPCCHPGCCRECCYTPASSASNIQRHMDYLRDGQKSSTSVQLSNMNTSYKGPSTRCESSCIAEYALEDARQKTYDNRTSPLRGGSPNKSAHRAYDQNPPARTHRPTHSATELPTRYVGSDLYYQIKLEMELRREKMARLMAEYRCICHHGCGCCGGSSGIRCPYYPRACPSCCPDVCCSPSRCSPARCSRSPVPRRSTSPLRESMPHRD